jgi:hypothetical protein
VKEKGHHGTTKGKRPNVFNILVATDLKRVLSDFLTDRDLSGVRPATLSYYRNEIGIFIKWTETGGAYELKDITPDVLRAYFITLRDRRKVKAVFQNYTGIKTGYYGLVEF